MSVALRQTPPRLALARRVPLTGHCDALRVARAQGRGAALEGGAVAMRQQPLPARCSSLGAPLRGAEAASLPRWVHRCATFPAGQRVHSERMAHIDARI